MSIQVTLLYGVSAVIFLWGVRHLFPTRGVVAGFGQLSPDNTKIITMEWLKDSHSLFSGYSLRVLHRASALLMLGPTW